MTTTLPPPLESLTQTRYEALCRAEACEVLLRSPRPSLSRSALRELRTALLEARSEAKGVEVELVVLGVSL